MSKDVLPPAAESAEKALLHLVLLDPAQRFEAADVQPPDFWNVRHEHIWRAITRLDERGEAIDFVSVVEELRSAGVLERVGGETYVMYVQTEPAEYGHARTYAQIIKRASVRRQLLAAASEIAKAAHDGKTGIDEVIQRAENAVMSATAAFAETDIMPFRDIAFDVSQDIDDAYLNRRVPGLSTGLSDMDRMLGSGLSAGRYYVLAGRPGMGKSGLALTIALHVAKNLNIPVALFSQEMTRQEVYKRALAMESGISVERLETGDVDESEYGLYVTQDGATSRLPIYVVDSASLTPASLRALALRMQKRFGVQLFIQDYLQLMEDPTNRRESRYSQVTAISRALKKLAQETNLPVLALAQLSREVERRQDKRPIASDLRDSGAIEQDADVIMMLYRDEVYNEQTEFPCVAEVIFRKNRNGPTGTVELYFRPEITKFSSLSRVGVDLATEAGDYDYTGPLPARGKAFSHATHDDNR